MPVIVFTDGSYEPAESGETAMVGGVLLDGDNAAKVFGCHVPPALLQEWHESGKEHQAKLNYMLLRWREKFGKWI